MDPLSLLKEIILLWCYVVLAPYSAFGQLIVRCFAFLYTVPLLLTLQFKLHDRATAEVVRKGFWLWMLYPSLLGLWKDPWAAESPTGSSNEEQIDVREGSMDVGVVAQLSPAKHSVIRHGQQGTSEAATSKVSAKEFAGWLQSSRTAGLGNVVNHVH